MRIGRPLLLLLIRRGELSLPRAAIPALMLATLAASVPAQRLFDELRDRGLPIDFESTRAVALGDVDRDGDLDIIGPGLLVNDGRGTFTDVAAVRLPSDLRGVQSMALGDVDGDGDLDIVFGSRSGQNGLYLNYYGVGFYTDATAVRLPAIDDRTTTVELGDVDGDGDLDIVFGNASGDENRLYLNDGTGIYSDATATHLPVLIDYTRAVALGDIDGDGDLDMALANVSSRDPSVGEQNRLYENDGSGTFTDVTALRMPVDSDVTYDVEFGDVDGDGDLDVVFGNLKQNQLLLNDGSGAFTDATAARLPAVEDSTRAVALGDVDGDGDLDLVFGNGGQSRLYLNDGSGDFTDATAARLPAVEHPTRAVALGDVDGDGDLDMVVGNSGLSGHDPSRVYLNLIHQVDTPLPVTPGSEYRLDAYARAGLPRLADMVFAFVSTAKATIPLPSIGTIGIDPSRSAALPPFLIPQPSGMSSVSFAVPNDPNLIGVPVYAQALMSSRALWHLTNVTQDQIVPLALRVTGLPRRMEPQGSEVEVSVAVTGAAASGVTVTVTSTGSGLIRLRRPQSSSQTIPSIAPGTTETVTWLMRGRKMGVATITFTLTDDGTGTTVQTVTRNVTIL